MKDKDAIIESLKPEKGDVTDLLLQAAVRSWDNQNFAIQVPTIHRLATNL
uniref:Uncharacterized protein n=1 Tax=Candidatus Kentrum sp. FM TaxID=2126340 RepID=A0A450TY81_9GAMM|nr:MAG: hypothetical protein BECKFM1743C_GA0114222_107843 [Candidatus Kentron sp. FM]VFJ74512.1 MAG: hypothetical protein BECKFM1743A_GA0114220_107833 [Candidatus Kentron sp. FM]VFK11755.1 MAG: hypothetical protein BECKFM1743B_GA0114221_102048 [Candidatus Kentron sp. FM]